MKTNISNTTKSVIAAKKKATRHVRVLENTLLTIPISAIKEQGVQFEGDIDFTEKDKKWIDKIRKQKLTLDDVL